MEIGSVSGNPSITRWVVKILETACESWPIITHLTYPRLWPLLLPLQLRLMLDNETNADSGSIRWLDNEDAFVILDQNKFEKVCGELISLFYVLPLWACLLHCIIRYSLNSCFRILSLNTSLRSCSKASFKNVIDGGSRGSLALMVTNSPLPPSREILLHRKVAWQLLQRTFLLGKSLSLLHRQLFKVTCLNNLRVWCSQISSVSLCLVNCNSSSRIWIWSQDSPLKATV